MDENSNIAAGGLYGGLLEFVKAMIEFGANGERNLSIPKVLDIDGVKYKYTDDHELVEIVREVPKDPPAPAPIRFFTLDGLIEYIRANPEKLLPIDVDDEKLVLHVLDPGKVALYSKITENQRQRNIIAYCQATTPELTFGRHMSADDFNTMLLSRFIGTEARETLFKLVATMTQKQSLTVGDDGVSQNITVKQGITTVAEVKFENPVPLKPMRTFPEVEQPESPFTLRVDSDAHPALFEADGGAWKNQAVENIRDYLCERLDDIEGVIVLA